MVLSGLMVGASFTLAAPQIAQAQQDECIGLVCSDNLFEAEGHIESTLTQVNATEEDAFDGTSGLPGTCFEQTWIEPTVVGTIDGIAVIDVEHTDPCGWRVLCFSHRIDVVDFPFTHDSLAQSWYGANASFNLITEWVRELGEPDQVDDVIRIEGCRVSDRGEPFGDVLVDGFPQPWGVAYFTTFTYEPLVDEIIDPFAVAEDLWAAIEQPDILIGSAPDFGDTTFVRAPNWVWLEEGGDLDPAVAMNPTATAYLAVRAVPTITTWDFGDGTTLECDYDQLVAYSGLIHDGFTPDDYGACTHTYVNTCFDDSGAVVASQCGTADGFQLTATITFEGEQALVTRANPGVAWPEPVWEPFPATRDATSEVIPVPVREILSLNG